MEALHILVCLLSRVEWWQLSSVCAVIGLGCWLLSSLDSVMFLLFHILQSFHSDPLWYFALGFHRYIDIYLSVSFLPLIIHSLCLELFGLCLLKQFWVSGMKSSWVYFLHLLERNFLNVALVHPYCYYFLCACFRGHLLLDPGKVSFVWWLYHIPLLSVFCTVLSVHFFCGIFQKKFVNLVQHLIIPEKVLEGTLRAWVSALDYSLA